MGHARADVFPRPYMQQPVKVDAPSAYPGTTNRADLIEITGLMSNKRDPRVPVKLVPENDRLENDPELSALENGNA